MKKKSSHDVGKISVSSTKYKKQTLCLCYIVMVVVLCTVFPSFCPKGYNRISMTIAHASSCYSTALLFELVLGSVIGYFVGIQGFPRFWTWVGGWILLFGMVLILLGKAGVTHLLFGVLVDALRR